MKPERPSDHQPHYRRPPLSEIQNVISQESEQGQSSHRGEYRPERPKHHHDSESRGLLSQQDLEEFEQLFSNCESPEPQEQQTTGKSKKSKHKKRRSSKKLSHQPGDILEQENADENIRHGAVLSGRTGSRGNQLQPQPPTQLRGHTSPETKLGKYSRNALHSNAGACPRDPFDPYSDEPVSEFIRRAKADNGMLLTNNKHTLKATNRMKLNPLSMPESQNPQKLIPANPYEQLTATAPSHPVGLPALGLPLRNGPAPPGPPPTVIPTSVNAHPLPATTSENGGERPNKPPVRRALIPLGSPPDSSQPTMTTVAPASAPVHAAPAPTSSNFDFNFVSSRDPLLSASREQNKNGAVSWNPGSAVPVPPQQKRTGVPSTRSSGLFEGEDSMKGSVAVGLLDSSSFKGEHVEDKPAIMNPNVKLDAQGVVRSSGLSLSSSKELASMMQPVNFDEQDSVLVGDESTECV